MKKRFVFWVARILKVEVFQKETTEIIHKTSVMSYSTIEIKKIVSLYEIYRRLSQGLSFSDLKNELAVELANRLINEDKVLIEQFKNEIDQTQHIRLVINVADQNKNGAI